MSPVAVRRIVLNLDRSWLRASFLLAGVSLIAGALIFLFREFQGLAWAALYKDVEGLETALRYIPDDPQVHEELGTIYLLDPVAFDPGRALAHLRRAVALSPEDARRWIGLGRAYEQQGDDRLAEAAYRRARELAPHHVHPRWVYANFLLRSGQRDRALLEFQSLAARAESLIVNICDLVWNATGGDAQALVALASRLDSRAIVKISQFLLSQGRDAEGIGLWQSLPWDGSKIESGKRMVAAFVQQRRWMLAYQTWREVMTATTDNGPESEAAFWNGEFRRPVTNAGFDWQVESTEEVSATIDSTTGWGDDRCLRLDFRRHEGVRYRGARHLVLVSPSTPYVLRFVYKTEGMLRKNGLAVEVADADDRARWRVQTDPLEESSRWREIRLPFVTSPETEAVVVTILREPISRLYDYIAGRVWFDSFVLEPGGERAGP
jgi:tetratricopeptide (TPR) repeat protein